MLAMRATKSYSDFGIAGCKILIAKITAAQQSYWNGVHIFLWALWRVARGKKNTTNRLIIV